MSQISVARLYEDTREKLGLVPVGGEPPGDALIRREAGNAAALVGHLNLIHPNRIQVLGRGEVEHFAGADGSAARQLADSLLGARPAVVVVCEGVPPPPVVLERAARAGVTVLATPLAGAELIEELRRYLAKALAENTERHGVCMDVLGLGVLITGDSGVGKSELGLELISRGHGLVADDVVEISRIAPTTLECRCPPMLKNFMEVRGLGVLDIRTIFGETAVRPKMKLRLIVHLEKPPPAAALPAERLPVPELSEDILGVTVRKVVLPVAVGRNLAVLLEAAVRNYILQLRGIDSTKEFLGRQRSALDNNTD